MTILSSTLIVKLIDSISAPAAKAARSLSRIGEAARKINGIQVGGSLADRLGKAAEANAAKMDALRGKMLDAVAVGYTLTRALEAPLRAARDFESVLLDIAQKGDLSDDVMRGLGRNIGDLAAKLNKSVSQLTLAKGVDILAGFGLDNAAALKLMEPIGRAAVAYKAEVEDLAKAGFHAMDNLKVPAEQFAKALDVMAQSGKEGAFELKDMAREFPVLTAAAKDLGMAGVDGVSKLAAALQIAKKGAATGSEAATNTANLMQKIVSPETTKKFKKVGIDIRAELKKVQKTGGDVFEMIAGLVTKATKGDMSKLGDFFQDSEVQKFLRPLIANLEDYKRIRDKSKGASGVVDMDFARRLKTGEAALAGFKNRLEDMARTIGAALLPGVNAAMAALGGLVEVLGSLAEKFPGITAGVVAATAGLLGLRVAVIAVQVAAVQLKAALLMVSLAAARFQMAMLAAMTLALAPFKAAALVLIGTLQTIALRFRLAAAAGLAFNGALVVGTLATFTRGLGLMAAGLLAALAPMRLIGAAFKVLRVALLTTGIGTAIAGFAAAATWISNNWSGVGVAFEAFKGAFMRSIKPVLEDPAMKGLVEIATKIGEAWESLTGKVEDGTMSRFGIEAGKAVGDITLKVVELKNTILETLALIPGLGFLKPQRPDERDGARRVGPDPGTGQEPGFDWAEFFRPAEGGDLVGTWATKLREVMKAKFAELAGDLVTSGAKLGISLVEGLQSAGTSIGAWASSLSSSIVSAFSGLSGQLLEAGKTAMQGLFDGMKSIGETIIGWATGLAGRIVGAFSGIGARIRGLVGGAGAPSGPSSSQAPASPPARATGGHVKAGHMYRVNDDGTDNPVELFRPGRSGTVLPSSERKKLGSEGGAGGAGPAPMPSGPLIGSISIVASGVNDPEALANQVLEKVEAKLGQKLRGLFADVGLRTA